MLKKSKELEEFEESETIIDDLYETLKDIIFSYYDGTLYNIYVDKTEKNSEKSQEPSEFPLFEYLFLTSLKCHFTLKDGLNYIELEINALNTTWDLFITRPYRFNAPYILHDWEIPGLKHAVAVRNRIQIRPCGKFRTVGRQHGVFM